MLFWRTAAISPDLRRMWAERALNQIVFSENDVVFLNPSRLSSFTTPFCYFRLIGIPEAEYRPGRSD